MLRLMCLSFDQAVHYCSNAGTLKQQGKQGACLDILALKFLKLAASALQLGCHSIMLSLLLSMPAHGQHVLFCGFFVLFYRSSSALLACLSTAPTSRMSTFGMLTASLRAFLAMVPQSLTFWPT